MILYDKHVPVDTENVFEALGMKFKLSPELKEYHVSNKAFYKQDGTLNDFTNESFMTMVRVVLSMDGFMFFNQKGDAINSLFVKELEGVN